jgi:hypothetical protein
MVQDATKQFNKENEMSKPETIKIDDVEYVRRDSMLPEVRKDYFIVRTQSAGVFVGNIKSRDGQEVVMTNARRLWYWDGAASISQLSLEGVKKPQNCKFPDAVPEVTLLQAIEILPCTDKAVKSIAEVKSWRQ